MMNNYRSKEGLSGSQVSDLENPFKFKYYKENGKEVTDAMRFGSLVHCLILEPIEFETRYLVAPEGLRFDERTAAYKALLEEAGEREILKPDKYLEAKTMADVVKTQKTVANILKYKIEFEKEIFWIERGLPMKGKLDMYIPELNLICDYKTTTNAKPDKFQWDLKDKGYLLQTLHYQIGMKTLQGADKVPSVIVIGQEKKAPYARSTVMVRQSWLDEVYGERERLLDTYEKCLETDIWPDYGDEGIIEL